MQPAITWTITAGDLLQAISILIVAFGFYNRLSIKVGKIETDIRWIKQALNVDRQEEV